MKRNPSNEDDEVMKQGSSDENSKSPAAALQQQRDGKKDSKQYLDQNSTLQNQIPSSRVHKSPISNVAAAGGGLQESFLAINNHQNSVHLAALEEQFTLAKINKTSLEETSSPWRFHSPIKHSGLSHDEEHQAVLGINYNQKISSLKTMTAIQPHNNNINQQSDYQTLHNNNLNNDAFEQTSANNQQYTPTGAAAAINHNLSIQTKQQISNSVSADYYQRGVINSVSAHLSNINSSPPPCTLWQIIRACAAFIFLIQQALQWINFAIVLQVNKEFAWTLLAFNLISPVVGLIYIVYQMKKYDYFLVLFPRKRVGVFFVILSFFNLDFVYAQMYQALYVQSSDYIKIFNENNLRKKRLNLVFQNFSSVIITSLVLFERNITNNNSSSDTSWASQIDITSGFFFVYIFFQICDLAFHMTFFSTDFFDDVIQLFFNLFDLCCTCFRDEEDDDDDEDEDASLVKYDTDKVDKQSLLFRQIPFTACTFLKFMRDNIFFSLSFYHNFFDLSIRAFLFGIAHEQNFFDDYSVLLVYELEVLFVAAIIVLIIVIGIINCCCEVSKTYFEKCMLIIVSCLQGIIIKLSRWNISRIFEGMTPKQLFILKFVPGLIRLCEILAISYILFIKSDESFHNYISTIIFVNVYIHYIGFIYVVFLAFELIYEVIHLVCNKTQKQPHSQSTSEIQDHKARSSQCELKEKIDDDNHHGDQINPEEGDIMQKQPNLMRDQLQNNDQQVKTLNSNITNTKQFTLSLTKMNSLNKKKGRNYNNTANGHHRKESSGSDAIQSFNDEPNPKQVYKSVNHLNKFQNEFDQLRQGGDSLSLNPVNLNQSNNSIAQIGGTSSAHQSSSNAFVDSKQKGQESKYMKKLHTDSFFVNRHKASFNASDKPIARGDLESQSNYRHQDSEKSNFVHQDSHKSNYLHQDTQKSNFRRQDSEKINLQQENQQASCNSLNQQGLQNQEGFDLNIQKYQTITKGSMDSLNYIKENGVPNGQNAINNFHLQKQRAHNLIAQRALQSERKQNEDISDSIIPSKFTQIQVETTSRGTNLNKLKTATELKRNSKEILTPLKSPSERGEHHSFQGSPTKLTSIPTRKVTDVINKYSNISSQRRKRSGNLAQSFTGQERADPSKAKRKSHIISKTTINQLADTLKSNNNNNNINNNNNNQHIISTTHI